jgi:hypothetical protein
MPIYAIIENGKVVNVIDAPEGWPVGINVSTLSPVPGIGWSYESGQFIQPEAEAGPSVPTTTPYMSHFGFLSRLTQPERSAIRNATATDPVLDDAMFLFDSAERIDVTLVETQQLVGYLALVGLISSDRIPQLLAPIDLSSPHAKP